MPVTPVKLMKILSGIAAFVLLSAIALGIALASPNQQSDTAQTPFEFMMKALTDANDRGVLSNYLRDSLSDTLIKHFIAPHTDETPEQIWERLSDENQTNFEFLVAVFTDAKAKDVLSDNISELLSGYFIDKLIAPHTGETSEQARSRLSGQPVTGMIPETVLSELPENDPPVNFRVTNYSHDRVSMQWEIPRKRGIANYLIERYDDNGSGYALSWRTGGEAGGGNAFVLANGNLKPDTRYGYSLFLRDAENAVVIESSVEVRTLGVSGTPPASSDATLSDLNLTGATLDKPFNSNIYWYAAIVPVSVTQTRVTPSLSHPEARYEIKLGGVQYADGVVPLSEGRNVISIHVVAADGVVSHVYAVAVTRGGPTPTPTLEPTPIPTPIPSSDVSLSHLSLSGVTLEPAFSSDRYSYTASVPNSVAATTVSARTTNPGASYVIRRGIGGNVIFGTTVPLSIGSNAIVVVVTSADGERSAAHIVRVTRAYQPSSPSPTPEPTPTTTPTPSSDVTLSDLNLSGLTLEPAFSSDRYSYTASVPTSVTQTRVTPTLSHPGARYEIKLGGVQYADGVVPLSEGRNVISVHVVAADGVASHVYTVAVTRGGPTPTPTPEPTPVTTPIPSSDVSLSHLSLSGVTLQPIFSSDRYSYTASVPNSVAATTVSARTTHPGASYVIRRGIGGNVILGSVVSLSVGSNSIVVVVTSADGERSAAHIVRVTRASQSSPSPTPTPTPSPDVTLSDLSLSDATLEPAFSPDRYSYTASIPTSVTQTRVTPTLSHPGARYEIKLGGVQYADGVVPLSEGRNVISIHVVAADGVASRVYTVVVTRGGPTPTPTPVPTSTPTPTPDPAQTDVTISSLSLSGVTLERPFSSGIYAYKASAPNSVSHTRVFVTMSQPGATYEIRRGPTSPAVSSSVSLSVGQNTIYVWTTSANGEENGGYIVWVTRAGSSSTPTPTLTPVPKAESTPTPTPTPRPESTSTPTPVPTSTPSPTPTPDPAQTDITISSLSLSGVTLERPFSSGIYAYNASAPNSVSQTHVSVTMSQPGAIYEIRRGPTSPAVSSSVSLSVGQNTIYVWTTSANGEENGGYIVWVTRASQ